MLGLKIFMESVWVGFFLVPYMYVYIKVRWWWGGGAAETKHVSMGLNIPSAGRIALEAFGPWAGWNSQGIFLKSPIQVYKEKSFVSELFVFLRAGP